MRRLRSGAERIVSRWRSRVRTPVDPPTPVPAASAVDSAFYHAVHIDVRDAGRDPLAHFCEHGASENRSPHSFYSPAYVRRLQPKNPFVGDRHAEIYLRSALYRRPRLLFVGHEASRTGAPAIILRLIEMFGEGGAFECFTLLDVGGERIDEFRAVSHVHVMARSRREPGTGDDQHRDEIERFFEPGGIFHVNRPLCATVNSAESYRIARALAAVGVPVISLLHEFASYYPEKIFEDFFRFSERVVLPSEFILRSACQYVTVDERKVSVRGQGLLDDSFGRLDRLACRRLLREEHDLPDDAFVVLNVGSMDQRKGIDLFVLAAARFIETNPDAVHVHFLWFGMPELAPGNALDLARRVVKERRLADRVRLLPATAEIERVFLGGDLFALTARADPYPCVVHEAMACGLPVIAFRDSGGAPEAIGADGGSLVEMGDLGELARTIAAYVSDPERRARTAAAAIPRVERDHRFADYFRDVYGVVQDVLGPSTSWPPLEPPPSPDHLVILRGRRTCADIAAALLQRLGNRRVEIVLLEGRFGPEIEECAAALERDGLPYRIAQPKTGTPDGARELLLELLRKPRPMSATLVDVDDLADPSALRLFGFPIERLGPGRLLQEEGGQADLVAALSAPLRGPSPLAPG